MPLDKSKFNERYNPLKLINVSSLAAYMTQEHFKQCEVAKREAVIDFVQRIEAGEIDLISNTGNVPMTTPTARHFLQYYYDSLPASDRYTITLDTYMHDGYFFPKYLIAGLKKIRPSNYLDALPIDADPVPVYRATATADPAKVKNELSWTTDIEVTKYFFDNCKRHRMRPHLFKATIARKDIIAYLDDREEKEILQYRSVKDVIEISYSDGV